MPESAGMRCVGVAGVGLAALFVGAALAGARGETVAAERGGLEARRFVATEAVPLARGPGTDALAVGMLSGGDVVTNLGCSVDGGRVWCAVRPFRGGVRGFVPAEALAPARGPDGAVPVGPDDSARRAAKGDFDARGRVPCAQVRGEALGTCSVGVARGTGGDASAVATFSNGFSRTLYFINGEFVRANATMSGVGTDTDWRLEGPTHVIRVDDQRYLLPDALVFGG